MAAEKCVYWGMVKHEDWLSYMVATDLGLGLLTWPNDSFEMVLAWAKRYVPGTLLVHDPHRLESYQNALWPCLNGQSTDLDSMKFDLHGTDFQIKIWHALRSIPLGQTKTYGEVANMIGRPNAVRAAAHAIGANPIAFLVPCHRVIGKDGSLSGYRGGIPLKQRLLELEGAWPTSGCAL